MKSTTEFVKPVDPRILTVVQKYESFLQVAPDGDGLCDRFLKDPSIPEEMRSPLLQALLPIERAFLSKKGKSVSFESYWDRRWFDVHMDDLIAVLIADEYQLEGRLGAGGQGRVYKVRNRTVHNRREALKVFLPSEPAFLYAYAPDDYQNLLKRFDQESKVLVKIKHDNLPQLYDVGDLNGVHFFTMEYIVGSSLSKWLDDHQIISPTQAAKWMLTAIETIAALHEVPVLHRDLKPGNLIIDQRGKLYVVDFGLSKVMPGARAGETSLEFAKLTHSYGYGSRGYVSPEQSTNASNVTSATDIYSWGATFYHLLNGSLFTGGQGPTRWEPQVPSELRRLVAECLQQNPEIRPTAAEVADRLRKWYEGVSIPKLEAVKPHRRSWLIGAGAATMLAGGGLWYWLGERSYSMPEIRSAATKLRSEALQLLLKKTGPDAWLMTALRSNAEHTKEAYTVAQTIYACLKAPELTKDQFDSCVKFLSLPFNENTGMGAIKSLEINKERKEVGWGSRAEERYTFSQPIFWMLCAIPAMIQRAIQFRSENQITEDRMNAVKKECTDYYSRCTKMLKHFQPASPPGAWNCLLDQNPAGTVYNSALAIQALMEAERSKLSWFGNNKDHIRATISYLESQFQTDSTPGRWLSKSDQQAFSVDEQLTLIVFAILLQAKLQADVPLPTGMTNLDEQMVELLFKFRQRSDGIPKDEDMLHTKASGRYLDSRMEVIDVATQLLWYPWSMNLCSSLIRWSAEQKSLEKHRSRLQNFLGHLVVNMGPDVLKRMSTDYTYRLAEMLLGLDSIAEL